MSCNPKGKFQLNQNLWKNVFMFYDNHVSHIIFLRVSHVTMTQPTMFIIGTCASDFNHANQRHPKLICMWPNLEGVKQGDARIL
jgi:hypothetical protein